MLCLLDRAALPMLSLSLFLMWKADCFHKYFSPEFSRSWLAFALIFAEIH